MNYKILIIEDQEIDRMIIKECLTEAGFTDLTFAQNGEEGLKKLEELKPNIIATDTDLPGINGFEICKRIKKINPKIKVIVMTGNALHVNFPKSREVGLDEYTIKTANCGELITCVKKCIYALDHENRDKPPK